MLKHPTPRRRKVRRVPILIIEDNADQWLIIRSAINQCFPEVEPIWINNVSQAITYLETVAADITKFPRLVLCNLYVPRREDGFALLEFFKSFSFQRKPPIIILSSSKNEDDIIKVYALNAASYIVKPESYHEWLNCFYGFRRYWWEIVTLSLNPS